MDEKIILNEKEVTKEEFEAKKKEIELQKGMKLIKEGENKYRIRIQG